MGIGSVASSIGSRLVGGVSKLKAVDKFCSKGITADKFMRALAVSTIASIAIKDGVGCGMYVYQSMNNDKIPEKRRKFVAALDLTNGILMIASQIAAFYAMGKLNDKLFHKWFNKVFDKKGTAFKAFAEQIRADQKAEGLKPLKKYILKRGYEGMKADIFGTFKFVTELVASTIGAKRILVPFIATPLASKVEKAMNKHAQAEQQNDKADNTNPSMKGNIPEVKAQENVKPEQAPTLENSSTNLFEQYKMQNA